MKSYSEEEKNKLLNEYLNKYGDPYASYEVDMLRSSFGVTYYDHMTQIYQALNLLEENENPYVGFRDLIENKFGLDINILEIGGGVYPALSDVISKRQNEIGKGSITVYDPLLSRNVNLKGVSLQKQSFSRYENVEHFDLIIGKEPCAATMEVIGSSEINNKDLLLSPCKCYHLLPDDFYDGKDPLQGWYKYILSILKRSGSVDTDYLESSTRYDNPIYTLKRK